MDMKCLFLLVVGLTFLRIHFDPAVEWNPGPHNRKQSMVYRSASEKKLFNELRSIDSSIARCASHRFFLGNCHRHGIVPKGFNPKSVLCSFMPNDSLTYELACISTRSDLQKMDAIIDHLNATLIDLYEQRSRKQTELANHGTDKIRNEHLNSILKKMFDDYTLTLQKGKIKKLDRLYTMNLNQKPNINSWIPELGLTNTERDFILNNECIFDKTIDAGMSLLNRIVPHYMFQRSTSAIEVLRYTPFDTIHIHHNADNHFRLTVSNNRKVTLYDSLNYEPTEALIQQIRAIYSPDDTTTPETFQCNIIGRQIGAVDCGLYALAYATELVHGYDPGLYLFDQSKMRGHLIQCLTSKQMSRFPKSTVAQNVPKLSNITKHLTLYEKWTTPKRTAGKSSMKYTTSTPVPTPTKNRFAPLANETLLPPPLETDEISILAEPTTNPPDVETENDTNTPTPNKGHDTPPSAVKKPLSERHPKSNKSVNNLSSRKLTEHENSVLELGLNFSPSMKTYDKVSTATEFFHFIRRLKLRDYFYHNPSSSNDSAASRDEDRDDTGWKKKNPDWYPEEVRQNRSAALVAFIENIKQDTKIHLKERERKFWNNMTIEQRRAIKSLASDQNIVIKPADKGGAIVIMDRKDYEYACLEHLQDKNFYEEVKEDPNPGYKKDLEEIIKSLKENKVISNFEEAMLSEGNRSPAFYGLPKIHKFFESFPPLRPICSGYSCCTVRLSEFIDSFLKPAARKTKSYIKDTTDFINKTKAFLISQPTSDAKIFLVTMDVTSLYTNIDHNEGIEAVSSHLEKRRNKKVPSSLLAKLMKYILSSNTMSFCNRFFHQIKGTAMGTPMAVNYANLFMANLESSMLDSYEREHGTKPKLWFRYIDDIFFIYEGSLESLNHFINYCNEFSARSKMKSVIKFTTTYSESSVTFLDTKVTLENGHLLTTLHCKPTDSHDYLHRSSYHPSHIINSVPKSQFIRIRRICSRIQDYHAHAKSFIQYFCNKGYNEKSLKKLVHDIANTERDQLLCPKLIENTAEARVPLVLPYHHKFLGISSILKKRYQGMILSNPDMKNVFPQPPLLSFRRQRNLRDILVNSSTQTKHDTKNEQLKKGTGYTLDSCMNTSGIVINNQNGLSTKVPNLPSTSKNVVYAAKCTKHNIIYVGQTSQTLNGRFYVHRSDILHRSKRSDLAQHYAQNDCDFEKDLQVSVLETVVGSKNLREFKEEQWIARLDTRTPNGLNSRLNDLGETYYSLFG